MQPPISRPPLPFRPEALPLARNRYDKALEELYHVARIRHMGLPGPGSQRANVFDVKPGLRLIISREYASLNPPDQRGPFEHVSIETVHDHLSPTAPAGMSLIDIAMKAYYYISRKNSKKQQPFWSHIDNSNIIHFMFESEFFPGEEEALLQDTPPSTRPPKTTDENAGSNLPNPGTTGTVERRSSNPPTDAGDPRPPETKGPGPNDGGST